MATLVSPGILVQEKDLTGIVTGDASTTGGIGIVSEKGPVEEVVTVGNESELVEVFGKPNASTFEWFFTAASFLKYANTLRVVRFSTGMVNACESGTAILVKNTEDWTANYADGSANIGPWVARSPGSWGNNLKVWQCPSATTYEQHLGASQRVNGALAEGATAVVMDDVDASGLAVVVNDIIAFTSDAAGATPVTGHEGKEYIVTAVNTSTNTLTIKQHNVFSTKGLAAAVADDSYVTRRWRWYEEFAGAPGTSTDVSSKGGAGDEMHIIITDENGGLTGTTNQILEKWSHVSKASDAKTDSGDNNYYVDALYNGSQYIFWMDHNAAGTNWGAGGTATTFTNVIPSDESSLASGTNDYVPTNGEKIAAYDLFDNDQEPVSLMIAGPGDATHVTNLIDIAEKRKDLVVFASPERADVVGVSNSFTQTNNVKNFFLNLASTSYAVFDSGYKKMYDKYNDQYRYIPLNGDTAGCTANAELVAEAWFSPAGLNRGNIRSAVGLAYNPSQTQRDTLYRNRVNPVCTFPGEGTLLWGDKTALARNSAFNRINVRRLFNYLEDAIERAAKAVLFEFNDEFTREQFVGMVEPFLRDVQGRRGLTDFQVVCDETNNTGQVIDANELRADIYIKPARSINFITLTFVATRTGVDFADVIG
jgi:hypothetical protein